MPNAVLIVNQHISTLNNMGFFVNDRGVFLYPIKLNTETFILRITQNNNKLLIKLDKTTMPKITSSLKEFMLCFAKDIAKKLNGTVEHHNLNINRRTDHTLFDRYEITTQKINKTDWINSLCDTSILNLEIGMGSGEFLTNEATKRKDEYFIGIEMLNSDFYIALKRFSNANLDNIKAIYYDARAILNRFKSNSINQVYLNFPEPWFKTKRMKHSILTQKTAKEIESILQVKGELTIFTDNRPFALSSSLIIKSSTNLKSVYVHPFITTKDTIKTKYEKKWLKYRRIIYKLCYKKEEETENRIATDFKFHMYLPKNNIFTGSHVFKVLNVYSKIGHNDRIVEITAGYNNNPQHVFFALNKNNEMSILPHSNFIINEDFTKAIKLTNQI